jgi:tRNA A37 threonylcarbamoyladenosine dehydratase
MENWLSRQESILGKESEKLKEKCVAVLGLGGVGGALAEALVRCGIGKLILVDHDTFEETNLNRQLFATMDTIGVSKVESAKKRLLNINPNLEIVSLDMFFSGDNANALFDSEPDFVADAIDTVSAKLELIRLCYEKNVPIISSMGTGNRLSPELLTLGTIEETSGSGCPLARIMRRELSRLGIKDLPVVFSKEAAIKAVSDESNGRHSPGSIAFVPPVAGYIMASHIVKKLIGII